MARRDDDIERGAQILDEAAASRPLTQKPMDLLVEYKALYRTGLPPGASTGWGVVDQYFTVAQGQMTIVTGWPGAGKSEWLDALCVNLAELLGWKIIFHSPENRPSELHMSKLVEKFARKPFRAGPTPRMSEAEAVDWVEDINEMFFFMGSRTDRGLTVEAVINEATRLLTSIPTSKVALIIDPWNELRHGRLAHMTETEYISESLSYIRNWSTTRNVHTFIVAHPQKFRRETGDGELPIPKPDMISGSQHWWNKADNCLAVARDFKSTGGAVFLCVQKVRQKHIGHQGMAELSYDIITGRYSEPAHTPFNVKGPRL